MSVACGWPRIRPRGRMSASVSGPKSLAHFVPIHVPLRCTSALWGNDIFFIIINDLTTASGKNGENSILSCSTIFLLKLQVKSAGFSAVHKHVPCICRPPLPAPALHIALSAKPRAGRHTPATKTVADAPPPLGPRVADRKTPGRAHAPVSSPPQGSSGAQAAEPAPTVRAIA